MAKLITIGAFVPEVGKCYEVHFGKITFRNETGYCVANIQVNGSDASQWTDLDTGKLLDPDIARYVVQAYKEIACP